MMRFENDVITQCFLFFLSCLPILAKASSNTPISPDVTIQRIEEITGHISCWKNAYTNDNDRDRPFVTLTFAQSLDGKTALYLDDSFSQSSSNFPISGEESLLMTHALRSIHDAILVGGNTLSIDNPRLSNRLWRSGDDGPIHQPRPVILDTHLRHMMSLGDSRRAQDLIVCCCQEAEEQFIGDRTGITLFPVPLDERGKIDLVLLMRKLRTEFGIQSLMVEGGSAVLSAFCARSIVDCLCVTVSPKLLGERGVPSIVASSSTSRYSLDRPQWFQLGSDCVLLSQWLRR